MATQVWQKKKQQKNPSLTNKKKREKEKKWIEINSKRNQVRIKRGKAIGGKGSELSKAGLEQNWLGMTGATVGKAKHHRMQELNLTSGLWAL